MLNIAICEDNKEHRKAIKNVVTNILFEQDDMAIEAFSDGRDVIALIDSRLFFFDLILLDIKMPGADGFAVAKAIREHQLGTDIVFVTAHEEYVYEGYVYKAFAYLKKPISTTRLSKELNRYLFERENSDSNFLLFHANGCRQRHDIRHIDYIESSKRKVSIVMGNSSFDFYAKLDDIEQQCAGQLVRTHQSFLVNVRKMIRLTKTEVPLENGKTIPVSKRHYEGVCQVFERL
jgi:DNA-binding LytR/AlgR family response regulator